MSKDDKILDALEDKTGSRTCPECGYQFSFLLFVKRFVLKYGFKKWTCPNCQKFINYNYFRANFVMTIVFLVSIFLFLGIQSKFGWDLPNIIFIISYFAIGLVLLYFDTFEKY